MKIGLFDHVEDGERPLSRLFDERLAFAQAADEAGIYCLHVAEHHATPLSMIPVPGVYLSAVARATKRMRLGPLVYLLTLYSPLRMIEEICMLDHLSHGRFDVGIGRGVSPFELAFHKVEHAESRDIFEDAYRCISAGLSAETLTYDGRYFSYREVPIVLRPLQRPHPPFWYASTSAVGATWAGEQGMHFVTLGSIGAAKAAITAFRAGLAKRKGAAQPKPEFAGGVAVGVERLIFVADSDAEAHRFGKPAMEAHLANLNWLRVRLGDTGPNPRVVIPHGSSFEEMVENGGVICGSPQTVRATIEKQAKEIGFNYLLSYLFLASMSLSDALRSLQLFSTEVMPHLEAL